MIDNIFNLVLEDRIFLFVDFYLFFPFNGKVRDWAAFPHLLVVYPLMSVFFVKLACSSHSLLRGCYSPSRGQIELAEIDPLEMI
jgi:hypothetical protein